METTKILAHSTKLTHIAGLILSEAHQIEQLKKLREEKNYLYYTQEEIEIESRKFAHVLEIKEMALENLKTKYINQLTKLN